MEQDFYKGRLADKYGVNVVIPEARDRQVIHQVIYDELCLGKLESESRSEYLRIIDTLSAQGAEAVILGCTEIGMLVKQSDTGVRLFDTTMIHAQRAVRLALD